MGQGEGVAEGQGVSEGVGQSESQSQGVGQSVSQSQVGRSTLTPSHPHTPTPSHPHTLTPSRSHTLSRPLTPSPTLMHIQTVLVFDSSPHRVLLVNGIGLSS